MSLLSGQVSGSFADDYLRPYVRMGNASESFDWRSTGNVTMEDGMAGKAFVHLFEWKWSDVAIECEQFLSKKKFTAVQISPPMEHIGGSQWWTRYQPVSYQLVSRSGNAAEFEDMVNRCAKA